MKNTQDIPWIRIVAEATAIRVSILLAFAIDAWWAERLERIAEREELSRLYDEFASNRERITEIRVDPFLVNLVAQRYFWAALVLRSLTATRDSADQVLSVISKSFEEEPARASRNEDD
jgi:hypothetical protein